MNVVRKRTTELAEQIRKTDVYINFSIQKNRIMEYPELKEKIDEFRERNYELQMETSEEELFDKLDVFEREYAKFRENPLVDEFLEAELGVCRMMQEVYAELTAAVDFE